jgi:hypothetical protein
VSQGARDEKVQGAILTATTPVACPLRTWSTWSAVCGARATFMACSVLPPR